MTNARRTHVGGQARNVPGTTRPSSSAWCPAVLSSLFDEGGHQAGVGLEDLQDLLLLLLGLRRLESLDELLERLHGLPLAWSCARHVGLPSHLLAGTSRHTLRSHRSAHPGSLLHGRLSHPGSDLVTRPLLVPWHLLLRLLCGPCWQCWQCRLS